MGTQIIGEFWLNYPSDVGFAPQSRSFKLIYGFLESSRQLQLYRVDESKTLHIRHVELYLGLPEKNMPTYSKAPIKDFKP